MSRVHDNGRSITRRAKGLGAAHSGVSHWWWQRVSAVALVPLVLWFLIDLLGQVGASREELIAWLSDPLRGIGMVMLLAAMFWHGAVGLVVVVEDYVKPSGVKFIVVMAVQLLCLGLALSGIAAVLILSSSP